MAIFFFRKARDKQHYSIATMVADPHSVLFTSGVSAGRRTVVLVYASCSQFPVSKFYEENDDKTSEEIVALQDKLADLYANHMCKKQGAGSESKPEPNPFPFVTPIDNNNISNGVNACDESARNKPEYGTSNVRDDMDIIHDTSYGESNKDKPIHSVPFNKNSVIVKRRLSTRRQ